MTDTQKHILIAVLGCTPQILTETLYTLCQVHQKPISEVWVVSTREGQQKAVQKLLDPQQGQFYQLQRDYPQRCGQIEFTKEHILVAQDGLLEIADIRNQQHSESFLQLITELLWKASTDPDTTLHCSIAGGRKTMSTYLALVLQLLARPQDRLYHVLVSPLELERHPEFYYPLPIAKPLLLPEGKQIDTRQARIDLIDIPFIRLRERLPIDQSSSPRGYHQLLEWAQQDLAQENLPPLALNPAKHTLSIGSHEIRLQPQRFCLYWYFADLSRQRSSKVTSENYPDYFEYPASPYFSEKMCQGLLRRFDAIDSANRMRQKFTDKVLDNGALPMSWVLQAISRINKQIRREWPYPYQIPYYIISTEGKRGNKCYGIKLDGRQINMPELFKES